MSFTPTPNKNFVHTLIHNVTYGRNISYNGPELTLISNNLQSAYHQPSILNTSIANKCQEGRILRPLLHPLYQIFARLGLVPNSVVA